MFCPLAANSSCVADSRTWPMLPGRRLELQREHGLDRVDDDEGRPKAGDLFEDALETGLGQDVERRRLDAEPLAARLDLVFGLLAGAVEHGPDRLGEVRRRLQQQRRLADARLAADQHEGAGHDAAAEHAVELADAGRDPLRDDGVDVGVELRPGGGGQAVARRTAAPLLRLPSAATGRSSTSEFQAPQSAQRPSHLGDCAPHSWQAKTVFCFMSPSIPIADCRLPSACNWV